MAGLEIISGAAVILPRAAELILPSTLGNGLEMLHLLTHGTESAKRNWAPGKANAKVHGAPVEHAGYLSLDPNVDYLETAMLDTSPGQTIMAVYRDTSAHATGSDRFIALSSFKSSTEAGTSITSAGSGASNFISRFLNSDTQAAVYATATLTEPVAGWACRMGTVAGAGVAGTDDDSRLINFTSGQTALSSASPPFVRVQNGLPYLIGSTHGSSSYVGKGDVALAMGWSRQLSPSERTEAYAWVKMLLATAGIAV